MSSNRESGHQPLPIIRFVRIGLALAMLLAGVWFYGPRLVETVSFDAVVNAPVIVVTSPIGGTLVRAPPAAGTAVRAGDLLVEIADPQAASTILEELATARASAEAARRAFAAEDRGLAELAAALDVGAARHLAATRVAVAHRLAIAEAAVEAAAADAERAERDHERTRTLLRTEVVSEDRLDETAAVVRRARAELEAAQAAAAELHDELRALAEGVYVGKDHNDVPYSRQRLDEVNLRRLEVQRRMGELAAERDALDAEMALKQGRLAALDRVELRAARDGVVWRNQVDPSALAVPPGRVTSLIACEEIVVTASLPTRTVEHYLPGTAARVRPVGSDVWWPARVEQIRAMGLDGEADRFAAETPMTADRRVIATLRPDDPAGIVDDTRFCDVGRTVEVRIAGPTGRQLQALVDRVQVWFAGGATSIAGTARPTEDGRG